MPARLAQQLVSKGLIPAATVEDAQRRRATHGGTLDTVLLEASALPEAGMLLALADVSGLSPVNLADFEPNPEMSRFVPANVADRLGAVPLSVDGGTLHVACCYPPPLRDLEEVSVLLGKKLETWIAIEARVRDWISAVYGTPLSPRFSLLLTQLDPARAVPHAPRPARVVEPEPVPLRKAVKPVAVKEGTLEDALTRDMVEQIARAVAEEPILLEVRKKPRAEEVTQVIDARELQRSVRATDPRVAAEPTVIVSRELLARESVKAPEPAARAQSAAPRARPWPLPPPVSHTERRPATQPEFPAIVVFPDPEKEVAPPAPVAPPPAPAPAVSPEYAAEQAPLYAAEPEQVPDWTLEQARALLAQSVEDRDALIEVALWFARRTFRTAAAFAVVRGAAVGWGALGEGAEQFRAYLPSIPLDAPSVFRTVAMTRGSYVGPVPRDANSAAYLQQMGRSPRTVFLFPVEVKDRLVCLIYGDNGQQPVSQRRLSELLLLCQELPGAFGQLILLRKQRYGATQKGALSFDEVAPAPPSAAVGWSPSAHAETAGVGRIASMAPMLTEDPSRTPPDFAPLLRKLTGPDAAARASAIAELARTPEPSARFLAQNFPGPTAWARLPVTELPDADELGPIPGALAKLGRAGAVALAPLLDADDADVRYFALLTAGSLPWPELVGGVLRGLFDFEPDLSSAARAAAAALRKLPRFQDSLPELRRELAAVDTLRRSLAARALGVLHDRGAIDGLINLTGSDDELSAQAASEALREITRAPFGPEQRPWLSWWAENRGRSRAQWLVNALRHADADVRLSAIEELSKVLNDNLGYFADSPKGDREAAIRRWEQALVENPRLRRLE